MSGINGVTDSLPDRDLATTCRHINERVTAFLNSDAKTPLLTQVQLQTRRSLAIVEKVLNQYKIEEISLSYNGGKDCLVLLILLLSSLSSHSESLPKALPAAYIIPPSPFPEVSDFVDKTAAEYSLVITRYTTPMKEAFTSYLTARPSTKAIFVGTRRTDPHGATLTDQDRTDKGWPNFVRLHPVLDWHYTEIWAFLRELNVEYCKLYDQGYTSLGGTDDTIPNPKLRVPGEDRWRPAYELVEDEDERAGRGDAVQAENRESL